MHIYIELMRPTPAWLAMSAEDRGRYLERVGGSLGSITESGAELVAVGHADPTRSKDAGYDYFSVWKLPSLEVVEEFEAGIEHDGWYEYFEQVNASGEVKSFEDLAGVLVGL